MVGPCKLESCGLPARRRTPSDACDIQELSKQCWQDTSDRSERQCSYSSWVISWTMRSSLHPSCTPEHFPSPNTHLLSEGSLSTSSWGPHEHRGPEVQQGDLWVGQSGLGSSSRRDSWSHTDLNASSDKNTLHSYSERFPLIYTRSSW